MQHLDRKWQTITRFTVELFAYFLPRQPSRKLKKLVGLNMCVCVYAFCLSTLSGKFVEILAIDTGDFFPLNNQLQLIRDIVHLDLTFLSTQIHTHTNTHIQVLAHKSGG